MDALLEIGKLLAIFSVVVLLIILVFGPYLGLVSRIEKLETYHSNICSECGQILHN